MKPILSRQPPAPAVLPQATLASLPVTALIGALVFALAGAPAAASAQAAPPSASQPTDLRPPAEPAQWVRSASSFPPPPGTPAAATAKPAQPQAQTSFGPGSYAAGAAAPAAGAVAHNPNGVAPLPPLAPPPANATDLVSPFSPREIVQMRKKYDKTRQAKAHRPVRGIPRISSTSVDLSPGAALPIARMLPGEMATLVFLDASGAAWPLAAAPRVSNARYFDAEWLKNSATVVISALSPYEEGNLSVMLQGSPTPVIIKLVSGETDSKETSRIVDYRLDLRIPGRAPGSAPGVPGTAKIALYDKTMQDFLDGLPPPAARPVKVKGNAPGKTRVWSLDGALFVRTDRDIQTAFEQSMAAADGTRVYRLPPTPFLSLADGARALTLELDID